jgi:predicted Zn-dependent peptidase
MVIHAATNGDPDLTKLHAYRANIQRVSRRQVRAVANKYFTESYARARIVPAR